MNFGQRLHRLRQEKGLSQAQLAKELGFFQAAIGYWERGEKAPSMDAVNIIAFFHVSINWLYGIEEPDTTESEFRKACQWLLVNECVNDANKTRDNIAIKYIKHALKSQK